MDPLVYVFGATSVGFAVTTIVALFMLREAEHELADRKLADANARADGERDRADVAARQLAAEQSARKAAEDAQDQQIEDALAHGGTIDPTAGWDRHAGAPAPGSVLPPAAAAAGAGRAAAAVPDRAAVDHGVAGADTVPNRRA